MGDSEQILEQLGDSERQLLRDLPTSGAPRTPGIYALWHDDTLLYVGMVRKDPKDTTNRQAAGVYGRLDTYRRCRLTSDFAVGCLLHYIVPNLDGTQRQGLRDGNVTIRDTQRLVQQWVQDHVSFSCVACDAVTADTTERVGRRDGVGAHGRPSFNPL